MFHRSVPARPRPRRGPRGVYAALSTYGRLLIGPRPPHTGTVTAPVHLNSPRRTSPGCAES